MDLLHLSILFVGNVHATGAVLYVHAPEPYITSAYKTDDDNFIFRRSPDGAEIRNKMVLTSNNGTLLMSGAYDHTKDWRDPTQWISGNFGLANFKGEKSGEDTYFKRLLKMLLKSSFSLGKGKEE